MLFDKAEEFFLVSSRHEFFAARRFVAERRKLRNQSLDSNTGGDGALAFEDLSLRKRSREFVFPFLQDVVGKAAKNLVQKVHGNAVIHKALDVFFLQIIYFCFLDHVFITSGRMHVHRACFGFLHLFYGVANDLLPDSFWLRAAFLHLVEVVLDLADCIHLILLSPLDLSALDVDEHFHIHLEIHDTVVAVLVIALVLWIILVIFLILVRFFLVIFLLLCLVEALERLPRIERRFVGELELLAKLLDGNLRKEEPIIDVTQGSFRYGFFVGVNRADNHVVFVDALVDRFLLDQLHMVGRLRALQEHVVTKFGER